MSRIAWNIIYLKEYGSTPQETINALYHDQRKSLREVSALLGVCRKALVVFMKKYNIERRLSYRQQAEFRDSVNKKRKEK